MLYYFTDSQGMIATNSFVDFENRIRKAHPQSELISKLAGELPVLFQGSFQGPSKYGILHQKMHSF